MKYNYTGPVTALTADDWTEIYNAHRPSSDLDPIIGPDGQDAADGDLSRVTYDHYAVWREEIKRKRESGLYADDEEWMDHLADIEDKLLAIIMDIDSGEPECGVCLTCRTQCHAGGDGSVICPNCSTEPKGLSEILNTICDIGLQDIYTDAPEYAGRVERLHAAIAALQELL